MHHDDKADLGTAGKVGVCEKLQERAAAPLEEQVTMGACLESRVRMGIARKRAQGYCHIPAWVIAFRLLEAAGISRVRIRCRGRIGGMPESSAQSTLSSAGVDLPDWSLAKPYPGFR